MLLFQCRSGMTWKQPLTFLSHPSPKWLLIWWQIRSDELKVRGGPSLSRILLGYREICRGWTFGKFVGSLLLSEVSIFWQPTLPPLLTAAAVNRMSLNLFQASFNVLFQKTAVPGCGFQQVVIMFKVSFLEFINLTRLGFVLMSS